PSIARSPPSPRLRRRNASAWKRASARRDGRQGDDDRIVVRAQAWSPSHAGRRPAGPRVEVIDRQEREGRWPRPRARVAGGPGGQGPVAPDQAQGRVLSAEREGPGGR